MVDSNFLRRGKQAEEKSAGECLQWLDSQTPSTVLYVSFGSQNSISLSNMKALALGLESSQQPFIWVVRPPLEAPLNSEFSTEFLPEGFEERVKEKKSMMKFLSEFEANLGIRIQCSREFEPLGTAGPLALAKDKLIDGSGQPIFVLSSDVICEFPLKEMLEFHKSCCAEASVMVTRVDEPSKYGVVVLDEETGRVKRFVEKPQMFVGNKINAGIYLLNPSVLDSIELKPTSIEKDIFPRIVEENQLYAMVLPGFWMDIGQPRDYLSGLHLYLDYLRTKSDMLASGSQFQGNVLIDESVQIGEGCLIGPDVSIGPGCIIEAGVRLSNCAIMRGVRIKKHSCVSWSIVGWHSTVGQWARIENMTILGEDVHIGDEIYSNGGVVLPHKEIKSNILKPEIVM